MKFKVGQKVRVKDSLAINTRYGKYQFTAAMAKYRGKTYFISDVVRDHYQLSGCMNMDGTFYWCFTDEMLEPANFTKDDLETGMVVEYRTGDLKLAIEDHMYGFGCWNDFDHYDDNLLCQNRDVQCCDIMRVYRVKTSTLRDLREIFLLENLDLIWERHEESEPEAQEMTLAEIEKELGRQIKIVSEE